MRTVVYVDGFNLYYAIKTTPYKWLDVHALCKRVLQSKHDIVGIRYFTAKVRARHNDPGQSNRQQVYLRALETLPGLSIHYGGFSVHRVKMPLAAGLEGTEPEIDAATGRVRTVEVIKTEEKGSDVNLAHFLVADGFLDVYECAVVVSNDSDLRTPIEFVRRKLGRSVGLLSTDPLKGFVLKKVVKFHCDIKPEDLRQSQFPATLTDKAGRRIHKPPKW